MIQIEGELQGYGLEGLLGASGRFLVWSGGKAKTHDGDGGMIRVVSSRVVQKE